MRTILHAIKITTLTSAFSLLLLQGRAQVIQEVQNSFNLYKQTALTEKIFVHTDKNIYLPGEIVWFKVYCVDGNDRKPLNLSKVAYIDVLDNNQNPVIQAKVSLKNGIGNGSLYIPVSVNNGTYRFRAYTSWMKNFNPEFYFEKAITLINPLKSPDAPVREAATTYDIQFFPEGGHLVAGITSKVGFKAADRDGHGLNAEGVIVNQHDDTVARFKSLKFGMGNFSFTPASNNTYRAVAKIGSSAPVSKDLPAINTQGYVMHLTDDGGANLSIEVRSTNPGETVYLLSHTGQTITAAETASINEGIARFTVSKGALGEGISHFTVFNNARQPVCERLYFKRPVQQLFIDAGTDQQQYTLRKKVNVNVLAKDPAGKPANADLSIAVYRIDSLQKIDRSDIVSYLWLGSDLRGNIESADYYLKNNDAGANEALDNLLLTQGWRRFQWNQLLQNKREAFNFLPEYNGHIITAKVINTETGMPAKNVITYLGVPGKRVQLYTARSDSSGRLLYNTKDFYGQSEIVDQTNSQIDSTYRIDILSPFSEVYSKTALPKFQFNDAAQKALQEHSLGIQTLNIYSGNQIKRFYDPIIDSSAFYGHPYKTYKLDDYTRFTTMEEVMREYIAEVNVVRSKGRFHIKVLSDRGFLDGGDPLVMLDGIPVFNIDKAFAIDPLKIRKLEVVPNNYFYGPSDDVGIFSFTSYKGDLGGVELDPKAIVMDYEGMQLRREFYSPAYDTQAQSASRIPDFRNLLYWSPSVIAQGKGAASFYTSDQPGQYVGVVQGITTTGQAGVQYFMFDVK